MDWVFSYALVDRTGERDLAELRSLQDWFLNLELQTVPGVAEVATVGGMVPQYQVVVDPEKQRDSVQELQGVDVLLRFGVRGSAVGAESNLRLPGIRDLA